jgi:DNA-binding beta-propeller fold protein YncE
LGQLNATTVAGNQTAGTITLSCPTGIVLDADGHLFITDFSNNRIVGSGPNGFRCIAGCTGVSGAAADQLYYPRGLSFDSYGNIYVADGYNYRIQKFLLATNAFGKLYHKRYKLKSSCLV